MLQLHVKSFSYKVAIPSDQSGHGGGFVFDCRWLNNPGRHEAYKKLTGRDAEVIAFFKEHSKIDQFVERSIHMIQPAVERYIERGFTNLSIYFGCTGGQHRSVYSADAVARYFKEWSDVKVHLEHVEQEKKNWINE
jgi:RNase adaptor protein for sRNA GlmZ degradation